MSSDDTRLSIYVSGILRHHPEKIGDPHQIMDVHGWVSTETLIKGINDKGKFHITKEILERMVIEDNKGRYRFNADKSKIKCCQGHSIEWVIPELTYPSPPEFLYHGTNTIALQKIINSGFISKMKRHAVHMSADIEKARQSGARRHQTPVVLKISTSDLLKKGVSIGVSENEVWCAEMVPVDTIVAYIYE